LNDPEKIAVAERVLESDQNHMRLTGLYTSDDMRIANEGKLHARWKLGRMLAKEMRGGGRGKVSTGLTGLCERLDMTRQTAMEAQRIGTLPDAEFENALKPYRGMDYFATFAELVTALPAPCWSRRALKGKHRAIRAQGAVAPLTAPSSGRHAAVTRGRRGTRS
jgi:hypothetical protein